MYAISTSIDNSNQAITCCVCLDTTPSNTNFRSWNCTGEHSDTICNKCHSHMMVQGNNCPLCRATTNINNFRIIQSVGQYFTSRESAINFYNLNSDRINYTVERIHEQLTSRV